MVLTSVPSPSIVASIRSPGASQTGFAMAAGAMVGQNLGAGREDRARQAVRLTVLYCLIVTVSTAALFLTMPRTLVGVFTTDPAVIDAGAQYLRIISIAQIGQTFELIFEGALAGAGYTAALMIVSTALTGLRIPLSGWWSGLFGLVGIWWALSLWLTEYRVTLDRGLLTLVRRGLLARGPIEIPQAWLRNVRVKRGMQAGNKLYYDLIVETADGKHTAARSLPDYDVASWLATYWAAGGTRS